VTAITAARNRERLLRDFLEFRRSAVAEGEKGKVREYLLVPGHDPTRADKLARNLATQGIEVRRAEDAFSVGSRQLPTGTYIVSNAQPSGRLIRNLLDPQTDQPEAFIKKQEERRARRQPDQIYDVTAWSLPLLYDVEVITSATALTVKSAPVPMTYDAQPPARTFTQAKVAYLMPWGTAAAALTADALQQGLRVHSVGGAFTLNGRQFPIGTALFRVAGNPTDLHARLAALATRHGAEIVPADTTYVESGTSLGSNDVAFLKKPRVLLAWDTPTSSLSAGWTRYVLERRFNQPVTVVRTSSLARARFEDFDVVVLPSGNFAGAIGDPIVNRLKDWLRAGGTLVTLAEASRWATGSTVGLLDTHLLLKDGRPDTPATTGAAGGAGGSSSGGGAAPAPGTGTSPANQTAGAPRPPATPATPSGASTAKPAAAPASGGFDYDRAIQPDRERPASQPGAILRVTLDTDHWLSAGHDAESAAMIEGQRVFAPVKLNAGRNVGIYGTKDRLIASGLIWPEAQDLLVQKPYVMHQPFGQGHVIAFAEDANYRAYSEASMLLFINAVLLGPGY
jgi:hypothetical protein